MTSLFDDDILPVPLEQTSIFYDESFFEGRPDPILTIPKTKSKENGDCFAYSENKQKRHDRFFVCKWCERKVSKLLFETGCVPECVISYFYRESPELYDLAFIELCTYPSFEQENTQPLCLPARNHDVHPKVKEYWRHIIDTVYCDSTDVRKRILLTNLSENRINKSLDTSEKNFRQPVKQKNTC